MRLTRTAPVQFCTVLAAALSVAAGAQSKQPPAPADYGQWETLAAQPRGGDGTVFWHQGIELYNIARRARKDVVLLAYAGEDHGLRKKANQIDYQHRILQWFSHYLRNEPAPAWITSGVSVLEREQELKRVSKKGS